MSQRFKNQERCLNCHTTITSTHRHDYVSCPCGSIAVDGGNVYWKRVGDPKHFDPTIQRDRKSVV